MGLMENEWICPSGPVDSDSKWEPEKNAFRPRIISRLVAFIECASTTGHYPKLLQVSKQILAKLRILWPEVNEIELFSVFKD
jgi:hypothetical protein